jgi:hypothetical protein
MGYKLSALNLEEKGSISSGFSLIKYVNIVHKYHDLLADRLSSIIYFRNLNYTSHNFNVKSS